MLTPNLFYDIFGPYGTADFMAECLIYEGGW